MGRFFCVGTLEGIWACPTQIFLLSTSQIASSASGKQLAVCTRNIGLVGLSAVALFCKKQ